MVNKVSESIKPTAVVNKGSVKVFLTPGNTPVNLNRVTLENIHVSFFLERSYSIVGVCPSINTFYKRLSASPFDRKSSSFYVSFKRKEKYYCMKCRNCCFSA